MVPVVLQLMVPVMVSTVVMLVPAAVTTVSS
jgi:hypothetical protein